MWTSFVRACTLVELPKHRSEGVGGGGVGGGGVGGGSLESMDTDASLESMDIRSPRRESGSAFTVKIMQDNPTAKVELAVDNAPDMGWIRGFEQHLGNDFFKVAHNSNQPLLDVITYTFSDQNRTQVQRNINNYLKRDGFNSPVTKDNGDAIEIKYVKYSEYPRHF